jgi:hypothetical protein
MQHRQQLSRAILLSAISGPLCLTACGDAERMQESQGAVHIAWTIAGEASSTECERLQATYAQVTVLHRGAIVQMYAADCDAFELLAEPLVPNVEYFARATLVDAVDLPKSQTVTSSRFAIESGQAAELWIDFEQDTLINVGTPPTPPVPPVVNVLGGPDSFDAGPRP